MIYTLQELQAMSQEDLANLTFFGDKQEYSLCDISHFIYPETVVMNSGSKIRCGTTEILEQQKMRKLRYDLMSSTLAGINHDNASRDLLRSEITASVKAEISELRSAVDTIAENAISIFTGTNSKMEDTASSLRTTISAMKQSFDRKMDSINAEEFGPKMKKIDTIVKAFSELLVSK